MGRDCVITVYHEYLQDIIDRHGNRSPEKTQAQLKQAMVRLLDSRGYHNTRINHICEEAGLAKGTFYTRFADKEAIIVDILAEYTRLQAETMPAVDDSLSAYSTLHAFNYWFGKSFQENAGIHRNFMQLSESLPKIRELWDEFLHQLTRPYVRALEPFNSVKLKSNLETTVIYSIGGMLDQALYAIYATHRSQVYEKASVDLDHLVETITTLQYRAIFLQNPEPGEIVHSKSLLKLGGTAGSA